MTLFSTSSSVSKGWMWQHGPKISSVTTVAVSGRPVQMVGSNPAAVLQFFRHVGDAAAEDDVGAFFLALAYMPSTFLVDLADQGPILVSWSKGGLASSARPFPSGRRRTCRRSGARRTRSVPRHTWPAFSKQERVTVATALSKSASANTSAAFLPPSSATPADADGGGLHDGGAGAWFRR